MARLTDVRLSRRDGVRIAGIAALAPMIGSPLAARAQDATPAAAPPVPTADGEITEVASGLANPRGFTWDGEGNLWIALAGSGGTTPSEGTPVSEPAGPRFGGKTAAIVRVANGTVETVVADMPSSIDNFGQVYGVADLAVLDNQLYALVQGGGASNGNPDQPSGLYSISADGQATLVVDLGEWFRGQTLAAEPQGIEPDGSWYAMAVMGADLWAVEAHTSQIAAVSPTGTVTRLVDASAEDPTFTGIVPAPEGGAYVRGLGHFPYIDGSTSVLRVTPDGAWSEIWTGLTAVTSVAVGPDGMLYAAEMTTNNSQESVLVPGTGRVVRMSAADAVEPVVTGLSLPVAIDFGPDGALYIAGPAIGADAGTGSVLRVQFADSGATPVTS